MHQRLIQYISNSHEVHIQTYQARPKVIHKAEETSRISSARKIIALNHNLSAKTIIPMKINIWNAQSMMNTPTEVCDFVLT